jgi:hypothetical protein
MAEGNRARQASETRVREVFGEACIDKGLFLRSGMLSRSIPTFVGEWILDRFCPDGRLTPEAQERIDDFIDEHLPPVGKLYESSLSLTAVKECYPQVMVKTVLVGVIEEVNTQDKDDGYKGISEYTPSA